MSEHLRIIEIGERCRLLRSKGMYINANEPGDEQPIGDGHFWCGRTQRIYGPDDQLVADEPCRNAARRCYEAR
jgi:hypothetical protein